MLTFRSLHNIDLESNQIVTKQIPPDFAAFTDDYLRFARTNASTKKYSVIDNTTQVVSCVCELLAIVINCDELDEELNEKINDLSISVARRLLRSETDAQEKIIQMNKYIKKGSLVQAIVPNGEEADSYLYIVAKVEHSEWFDGESLRKSFGFPTEKKNVWKSAVIPIYVTEDEFSFGSIRIYMDNEARYWATNFLEVTEEKSDESNTKAAFEAIDRELRLALKKEYPRDYYILRNTVIKTLRTPQLLNYPEYISCLLDGYVPEDNQLSIDQLQAKLLTLPEKKHFDTQFRTAPQAITARRRLKFEPTVGIVINIDGAIDEYKTIIVAGTDENDRRILKVRCSDEDTYRAFGGS